MCPIPVSPWVPLSHHRHHVCADGGIVHIAAHPAAPQVAKDWQGERISHGVDVEVWHKLNERLPGQEDGAHTLAQQREVGVEAGLHQQPVLEEHKLNGSRQGNVEAPPSAVQDLLSGHTLVSGVHHKPHFWVPEKVLIEI